MEILLRLVAAGLQHLLEDALSDGVLAYKGILADTPHLALFTAGPGWSSGNVLAQYTEADFTGYARKPAVFANAGLSAGGRPQCISAAVNFSPTGTTITNTAAGVLLVSDVTAGELWGVGYFSKPIELASPLADLAIIAKFAVPDLAPDWGKLVTVS